MKDYPLNKPLIILPTDLQALEYELYIDEEMNRCECTSNKVCYNCNRKAIARKEFDRKADL